MPNKALHTWTTADGLPIVARHSVVDTAARLALTTGSVPAVAIGGVCYQEDTQDFYICSSVGPIAWKKLTGTTNAATHAGVVTVDFGSGSTSAVAIVTGQDDILAGSALFAGLTAIATASHSADEHVIDGPVVMAGAVVPGVGFSIFAHAPNTRLYGEYTVHWSWV